MEKIGKKICIINILLFFIIFTHSLEVKLYSEQNEVIKGETFRFYVQIEGSFSDISKPNISIPDYIKVLSAGTSRSTNIVNWETTYIYKYIYTAISNKEGDYILGPASIKIDSKEYRTEPFSLKVVKAGNSSKNTNKNSNYIAYQEFNKKEYYVGEKINYKIVFATSDSNVRGLSINESENISDFLKGEVTDERTRRRINGKIYDVIILNYPLTALKSGTYSFDDVFFTFDRAVKKKGRSSFFDDSFFGNDDFFSMFDVDWKKTTVICDSAEVSIKDIPAAPKDFSGGVGKFVISSKIKADSFKKGIPVTLSVLISGAGNINSIDKPNIRSEEGYSISFSGEQNKKNEKTGSGERQFDYVLIPEKSGDISIRPVKITYFDIEEEKFESISTDPIDIKVEENENYVKVSSQVNDYSNNISSSVNKIKDEDIEYIFFKEKYKNNNTKLLLKFFKNINLILIIIFVMVWVIRSIKNTITGRKNRMIDKAITELNKSYKKGEFYKDFHNLFWKTIKEVKDLSSDSAGNLIIQELEGEIPDNILKELKELNDSINFYAYAGSGSDNNNSEKLLFMAVDILKFLKSGERRKR